MAPRSTASAVLLLAACSQPYDFTNLRFPCGSEDPCPAGQFCSDGFCGPRDGGVRRDGGRRGGRDGGPRDMGVERDGGPTPVVRTFCEDDETVPPRVEWWFEPELSAAEIREHIAERAGRPSDFEVIPRVPDWRYTVLFESNTGANAVPFEFIARTPTLGRGGHIRDWEMTYVDRTRLTTRLNLLIPSDGASYWARQEPVAHAEARREEGYIATHVAAYTNPNGDRRYVIGYAGEQHVPPSFVGAGATQARLLDFLDQSVWRPFGISYYRPTGEYVALTRLCPAPRTWWADDVEWSDVLAMVERDGSRPIRFETKDDGRYLVLLENNLGPYASDVHRIVRERTTRLAGYAVRRVDTSTEAAHLESRSLPAGDQARWWIAMAVDDAIQRGALTLADQIPIYTPGVPCPGDAIGRSETVADALAGMLEQADAARAKALAVAAGGEAGVRAWVTANGYEGSTFEAFIGCDDAAPNVTTLADLSRVALALPDGYPALDRGVDPAGVGAAFQRILDEETAPAAFSAAAAIDYLTGEVAGRRIVAGRVTIPACSGGGRSDTTWSFAMFVDGADASAFDAAKAELSRRIVRDAVVADLSCL